MSIFSYFRESFARKKARRVFQEYPYTVVTHRLETEGDVQYANWRNPLVKHQPIHQSEIDFYRKFALPGSLAIDIGANVGDTTVPMAVAVGASGLTLGFEPNPVLFKILTANAGLNLDKTNLVPVNYAITEQSGEFFYTSSEASFGNGGVSQTPKNEHGRFTMEQKITGVNLVDYLTENHAEWLPKLSLIKVDVEGHDKDVIQSAASLIAQYKPVLIAECFSEASLAERQALYDLVAGYGYNLFYFAEFDTNAEVVPLIRADMNRWKNFNFYATPN
jgi:FkbM family methyltransferase